MSRLLIVDDFPIIVDGLAELFSEKAELDMEIFRAYSVIEALEVLGNVRIDIVLSDIRMPVKTGIDLLKEIRSQWPRCKVIFLTSYNDFQYARDAISLGGYDYILKTEGDERIIESVCRALEELRNEQEYEELIKKSKEQYNQSKPILQKEFFTELLAGRKTSVIVRNERFKTLEVPLDAESPVFLLLIRLDENNDSVSYAEWVRRAYSVQNILGDYLNTSVRLLSIYYGMTDYVCFLQPGEQALMNEDGLNRLFRFTYGSLELVQEACVTHLKLKVSFLLGSKPVTWEDLSEYYIQMSMLFKSGIGLNPEVLTTDAELQKNNTDKNKFSMSGNKHKEFRINRFVNLAEHLNNGQEEEFFLIYSELMEEMQEYAEDYCTVLGAYHFLSAIFLSYLNKWNMVQEINKKVSTANLRSFNETRAWNEYAAYFNELAVLLFQYRLVEKEEQTNTIIVKLQEYICDNLHDDLSLTRLGGYVHLNSSYLSRLYKQITGSSLSDFISEQRLQKARALLCTSNMKILDIALLLGYNSGIAFTRFFKKMMGMTPQEFRDINKSE